METGFWEAIYFRTFLKGCSMTMQKVDIYLEGRCLVAWILEVMDIRRILKSYEVSDDIYIYIRPV